MNPNKINMDVYSTRTRMFSVLLIIVLLTGHTNSTETSCVHRGKIHTSLDWYGYLLQKTFQQNVSRISYAVSYPASECCAYLLIYYDDQIRNLTESMTCQQRQNVLAPVKQVNINISYFVHMSYTSGSV